MVKVVVIYMYDIHSDYYAALQYYICKYSLLSQTSSVVCLSVAVVSPGKMAETTEMLQFINNGSNTIHT